MFVVDVFLNVFLLICLFFKCFCFFCWVVSIIWKKNTGGSEIVLHWCDFDGFGNISVCFAKGKTSVGE